MIMLNPKCHITNTLNIRISFYIVLSGKLNLSADMYQNLKLTRVNVLRFYIWFEKK